MVFKVIHFTKWPFLWIWMEKKFWHLWDV